MTGKFLSHGPLILCGYMSPFKELTHNRTDIKPLTQYDLFHKNEQVTVYKITMITVIAVTALPYY